jgi:hypothetical protein
MKAKYKSFALLCFRFVHTMFSIKRKNDCCQFCTWLFVKNHIPERKKTNVVKFFLPFFDKLIEQTICIRTLNLCIIWRVHSMVEVTSTVLADCKPFGVFGWNVIFVCSRHAAKYLRRTKKFVAQRFFAFKNFCRATESILQVKNCRVTKKSF